MKPIALVSEFISLLGAKILFARPCDRKTQDHKAMTLSILCLVAVMFVSNGFAADPLSMRHKRLELLGKTIQSNNFRNTVFKDGYEFDSIEFDEADEGGSEPIYILYTSKYVGPAVVKRCYTVEFNTDHPKREATIELSEELCN